MSYNNASNNQDGWMTVERQRQQALASPVPRQQAPAAFGAAGSSERRMAPSAFGSRGTQREAPAAFGSAGSSQTRTWNQDGPSAFGGGGGGRREAPAAFGGGAAGDDRRRRLEEKAADARHMASHAAEERRKAAEAAAIAKKAMDMNDEESYPTLGVAPKSKKASVSVSLVIDGSGTVAAAAAAPKSKWGAAAAAAPSSNSWATFAEPEVKPLSMAQRIAAASARVDEEEAIRQAMEHRERVLNRPCFDHYTDHQRRLASLPRRTLDDGFEDDPVYRNDLYENDGYCSGPAEEEGEDTEVNANLISDRRRGDKGVW